MTNPMTQELPPTETKSQSTGPDAHPQRKTVTLKDVAKRANVSPTTASLFFNGREDVCAEATADRLRQAAADLQYTTNRGRRHHGANRIPADHPGSFGALSRTGRGAQFGLRDVAATEMPVNGPGAYVFGVCIPHYANPNAESTADTPLILSDASLDSLWRGISHVADIENCQILQYPRRIREGQSIQSFFSDSRADGVIMLAAPNDPRPAALSQAGMPVVLVGRLNDIPEGCGAVYALESDVVDLALSHLWTFGHRRIAYASASAIREVTANDEISRRRWDRYCAWTQIRGVFEESLVVSVDDRAGSAKSASEAVARLMAISNCPTAIFCESDAVAAAVCRAAGAQGIRIPDELSVLGVGNSSPPTETLPTLSSVVIPYEQIGVQAVIQLTRLMEGAGPVICRAAVPVTSLIARQSTGQLRSAV